MTGIKCAGCGRFISYDEMDPLTGSARFIFEPDSHYGPEVNEWECSSCAREAA